MSVFLGWMPGEDALPAFAALQQAISSRLPADAPRHAWRNPRQWHMTVHHLGECLDPGIQARIDAAVVPALADTQPITCRFDGIQYWPHASVLVARIEASDALLDLFRRAAGAMHGLGFSADTRKPRPHATLAYLPRGAQAPAACAQPSEALQTVVVDRLQLLRTAQGRYDVLASWSLPSDPAAQ